MVTSENLAQVISPSNLAYALPYIPLFDSVLPRFGIDTPLRKVHFLAQIAHESNGFRAKVESLYYSSAERLCKIFPKYFPTLESASTYVGQPERTANKIYANRMENGDETSGDGWRFRGRGLIQLTGRYNYTALTKAVGQDFVNNPDLVASPEWALSSACWYWQNRNINKYADADDIEMVTLRVNGGKIGIDERRHYLEGFKKLYNI